MIEVDWCFVYTTPINLNHEIRGTGQRRGFRSGPGHLAGAVGLAWSRCLGLALLFGARVAARG